MKNTEQLSKFFETEFPLNKDGMEELFSLLKIKTFKKGAILLKMNDEDNQLRFLSKGVVREYYSQEQKETNINFYTKPQFITDLVAFIQDLKTKKNQQSLSEVELLVIDKKVFQSLLNSYSCGQAIVVETFQKLFAQKETLEYNRITKSPDELYKDLLKHQADWFQVIPQYHIASYLNVTPETLSRIRKRIY